MRARSGAAAMAAAVVVGCLTGWAATGSAAIPATGQASLVKVTRTHTIAGYVAGVSNSATAVMTFTAPRLDCVVGDTGAIFSQFAIGGSESGFGVAGQLEASCGGKTGTSPRYAGLVVVDGTVHDMTGKVHGGDPITVDLVGGPTGYNGSLSDAKTGASASGSGAGVLTSDVQASTDGAGTFPKFRRIDYSVTINGASMGSLSPTEFVEVDSAGHLEIGTSAFSGTVFSNYFKSNT